MKKLVCLVLLLSAFVLSSCGGARNGNKAASIPKIDVIESIPNISAPDWVNKSQEFTEEKGNYFYRGISEGMTNIEAARRSAQAAAITQIAEQVKATIRVEFSRALESGAYDENAGAYLKDVFFSVVDNLTISGAAVAESYSQHVSETVNGNSRIYWRSYALARISAQDYKKLVQSAFSKTNAQSEANKSAKELSKEVENRFFEGQKAKEQE